MKFTAILPKKQPITEAQAKKHVSLWLRNCAFEFQREMQEYPQWQPWTSRPPRTGPRAGGRRTGTYGRGWIGSPRFTADSVTVTNDVRYAGYVGGPTHLSGRDGGQTAVMKARGWKSISDVAEAVAKKSLPAASRIMTE